MNLIDTHGHVNFEGYEEDRQAVIDRIKQQGMRVIVPSSQLPTSQKAVELAQQFDFLFAAIGIHPIHAYDEEFRPEAYQLLIDTGFVKAIGETGIDYYHVKEKSVPFEQLAAKQEELFRNFIKLALINDLPIIAHVRLSQEHPNAYQEVLRIMKDLKVAKAVIHCYTGDVGDAADLIKAGYYLGFTGIVTFDKTGVLEKVVKQTPLEQLLIETDAPYLSPEPYRGKRNEPIYVLEVARKIAQIKGLTLEEVIRVTTTSAVKLFKLP